MTLKRAALIAAAAVVLLAFVLRARDAASRYYDTDELEHLHAAGLVANGAVPYRDFFEHHGPLLWYVLGDVERHPDPETKAALGRKWMTVFWAAILAAVALMRRGEETRGALAAAWLSMLGTFAWKTLEIRPDVPALACLALCAVCCARDDFGRQGRFAGVFAAAAFWFTPKAALPAAAIVAASLWRRGRDGRPFAVNAAIGAGAVLVLGLVYFDLHGALRALWEHLVVFNARFRRSSGAGEVISAALRLDWFVFLVGLRGLGAWRRRPEEAAWLAGAALFAVVNPAPQPQSLLFMLPPLTLFAVDFISPFARAPRSAAVIASFVALTWAGPLSARAKRPSNELQRERWKCASALPPGARVWDSWSGDAFHRPHADDLWFLPDENRAQFSSEALEARWTKALESPRTAAAIRCESCLAALPAGITIALNDHFKPSGCGRLWVRK